MKLLALQTNPAILKKNFLVEGEQDLLTTSRHGVIFVIGMFWSVLGTIAAVFASFGILFLFPDAAGAVLTSTILLILTTLFFLVQLFRAYVDWRYNFLVITTEKVVIIR